MTTWWTMFFIVALGLWAMIQTSPSAETMASSMGNANVESCLLRVIRRIRFPKPRGGGQVKMNSQTRCLFWTTPQVFP